ncbi:conserved hypothetical protein, partial [Trichinella spiralis]|uniref:hypothetical protein n=1 Tax=Trichinella spiralis TaxID=6334 RepID=UPI0001EFD331
KTCRVMPAPSNPNSSISSKNDNYPLVNPHQTGNQRTDVSLTQQALVNNQQYFQSHYNNIHFIHFVNYNFDACPSNRTVHGSSNTIISVYARIVEILSCVINK